MSKGKLLIVDDEPDIRKVLKKRLELEGFQCLTAKNGTEAIKVAQEEHPALIVLDLVLPGKDGFQVYQELKGDENTRNIPIVVYTAQSPDIVAERGFDAISAVDFVLKPFESEGLISLIEKSLKNIK